MVTGYLPDYEPQTPPFAAQPVLDEDATAGLCGTNMPNGKGLLVWRNGTNARFAVVSSTADFLVDDVVPSANMATLISGNVNATSCFTIDNVVYAAVGTRSSTTATLRIYTPTVPSNPYLGWTLAGTVMNTPAPGTQFAMLTWQAGIPLQLASGRWVMACGGWELGASPGAAASGSAACAWYSDNGAAGPWVNTVNYPHFGGGFPRVDFCSPQVGLDPATGYLWFCSSGAGGNDLMAYWRSTDSGASFGLALLEPVVDTERLIHFVNNNTSLYASQGLDDIAVLTGDGTSAGDWVDTGHDYSPVDFGNNLTFKGIPIPNDGIFYFWDDKVSYFPYPGIQVLPYPPLHIPFKDRLKNVTPRVRHS